MLKLIEEFDTIQLTKRDSGLVFVQATKGNRWGGVEVSDEFFKDSEGILIEMLIALINKNING